MFVTWEKPHEKHKKWDLLLFAYLKIEVPNLLRFHDYISERFCFMFQMINTSIVNVSIERIHVECILAFSL